LRGTAAETTSFISSSTQLRCRVILRFSKKKQGIFMHLSMHLHANIQSPTWNFSKLQKWSGMRQSNLAETEALVGRRNCREFGHKFYFLFLVRRIWRSSQPGYKWERTIDDRARKRQGTLTSLVRCREYWRHMRTTQCELLERVLFFSEVLDQVIFIILLLDQVIFFVNSRIYQLRFTVCFFQFFIILLKQGDFCQ
jgi:hypothetical protein